MTTDDKRLPSTTQAAVLAVLARLQRDDVVLLAVCMERNRADLFRLMLHDLYHRNDTPETT